MSGLPCDPAQQHADNLNHTQRLLAAAGGWPVHERPGWVAADGMLPSRFFSAGVLTGPDRDAAATVASLLRAAPWRAGGTTAVIFDPWGRTGEGDSQEAPLMVRAPAAFAPADERVQVARNIATLRLVEQALGPALDLPAFAECAVGTTLGDTLLNSSVAAAVGVVDGEPCAVALAVDDGATIGLYLVGVAPGRRSHGLGAAVSAAAVDALVPRPALLIASKLGRPVYERLGWRVVGQATLRLVDRPVPRSPSTTTA